MNSDKSHLLSVFTSLFSEGFFSRLFTLSNRAPTPDRTNRTEPSHCTPHSVANRFCINTKKWKKKTQFEIWSKKIGQIDRTEFFFSGFSSCKKTLFWLWNYINIVVRSLIKLSSYMFYIGRPFISVIESVSSMDRKRIVNHLMSLNTLPEIPHHQSLLFQHYSESTSLLLKPCFNSHSDTSQNNAYQLFANQNPNLQNNLITIFQNDPLFIDIKTKINSIFSTHGQKQFSYMLLPWLISLRTKIFPSTGIVG